MEQRPLPPPPPLHPLQQGKEKDYEVPKRMFGYLQGTDQRWQRFQTTEEGACMGLSVWWIITRVWGNNFLPWLNNKWAVPWVTFIMQKQSETGQTGGTVLSTRTIFTKWMAQFIGERTDLDSSKFTITVEPQEPLQAVIKKISKGPGLVLFDFHSQMGGHACAFYVNDPYYVFFDPNFGEDFYHGYASFASWMQVGLSASLRSYLKDSFLQFYQIGILYLPFDVMPEPTKQWLLATYSLDAYQRAGPPPPSQGGTGQKEGNL
jgi:hypothetical protein